MCRGGIGLWFIRQQRSVIEPGHLTVEIYGSRSQNIRLRVEIGGNGLHGSVHTVALDPGMEEMSKFN